MSQQSRGERPYAFDDDLPIGDVPSGTNILVDGAGTSAARELALELLLAGNAHEEGMLLVSTSTQGSTLLKQCRNAAPDLDESRLRIIDSTPDSGRQKAAVITRVDGARDLSGISIEYSSCVESFREAGVSRIRTGVFSVTALLLENEFKTVSKLLHALTGRVAANDGLGVFYVDTTGLEDRVVDTLAKPCDGRINVRTRESDRRRGRVAHQLRVRGLRNQPREWTRFEADLQWPREVGSHAIDRRVRMAKDVDQEYRCLRCGFSATGELDNAELRDLRCGR